MILRTRESGEDLVVADYAWRAEPAARAGSMILRLRNAEIDRLLVTFGELAPVAAAGERLQLPEGVVRLDAAHRSRARAHDDRVGDRSAGV